MSFFMPLFQNKIKGCETSPTPNIIELFFTVIPKWNIGDPPMFHFGITPFGITLFGTLYKY